MDERWTQLMHSTEQEILGGCDVLGNEARAHMSRGAAPRWMIRKVAPAKSHNRPRMARDTRWWRVLSNRLQYLLLMEALPTRRPHLPQQPEQIERLRTLTVLDNLHMRDRKARENAIAEYAREASQGAAGLLHRLTKPRAVRCPRDAAQGEGDQPA